MSEFFDKLETRDPTEREAALFGRLPEALATAKEHSPGWAKVLANVNPADINSRAALAALPVTRKTDLMEAQQAEAPFGGFLTRPAGELARVFVSPGPVRVPEGPEPDPWNAARALYAAGARRGETVANTFGYHATPGAFILESGLKALGCPVFAAGPGRASETVATIALFAPTVYCGVPDYLNLLLEAAADAGIALSFNKALVSGAALPASLRERIEAKGVTVAQCYATADLGVIAYESAARDGLILSEDLILEIVRPGTGEPVADGEVGEIVVTRFSPTYPLFRFATGDLSAILEGPSPCGRTNQRIKGWMGRADQRTKVKGMFVDPAQIAEIVRRHPEISRARLVVNREGEQDRMTLRVALSETSHPDGGQDDRREAISQTLKAVTQLSGKVEIASPSDLPNDGKVIDDNRPVPN